MSYTQTVTALPETIVSGFTIKKASAANRGLNKISEIHAGTAM